MLQQVYCLDDFWKICIKGERTETKSVPFTEKATTSAGVEYKSIHPGNSKRKFCVLQVQSPLRRNACRIRRERKNKQTQRQELKPQWSISYHASGITISPSPDQPAAGPKGRNTPSGLIGKPRSVRLCIHEDEEKRKEKDRGQRAKPINAPTNEHTKRKLTASCNQRGIFVGLNMLSAGHWNPASSIGIPRVIADGSNNDPSTGMLPPSLGCSAGVTMPIFLRRLDNMTLRVNAYLFPTSQVSCVHSTTNQTSA